MLGIDQTLCRRRDACQVPADKLWPNYGAIDAKTPPRAVAVTNAITPTRIIAGMEARVHLRMKTTIEPNGIWTSTTVTWLRPLTYHTCS